MATSLITPDTRIKVSSVLNRDVTNFGKQHLTDGNIETCWNSQEGLPQHILLDFPTPVSVQSIVLQFAGGFAGRKCIASGSTAETPNDYSIEIKDFYPKDNHTEQTFTFEPTIPLKRLKIIFEESTDFFGRITVYKLDVLGSDASSLSI